MKKDHLFIYSVLLNVLLFVLFGGVAYHKRHRFVEITESLFNIQSVAYNNSDPKEEDLKNFNNEPLEAVNDSIMIGAKKTISCLFLGNSLSYCGTAKEEPNKEKRGLTSTSKEKDFIHVLVRKISEDKNVNVKYSILNIAQFERTFTVHSFSMNKLQFANNKQPDFLFVQIGENIDSEDMQNPAKFEEEYTKLLSLFPNSIKFVMIPFWPEKIRTYAITRVAIKNNSYLVDLSHLGNGTDPNNYASSQRKYENPAVGAHPGDYGFANIAECIYATFNAVWSN